MEKEKEEDIWSRKIRVGRGEGRKYLEKKTIFFQGKYFFKEEKEKEDNIWRRKIFGEGKYLVHGGVEEELRRKRRNHLEEEH